MLPDPTVHVATFAAVFAALFVAHQVADHWIQTQHQANGKGRPGWPGRLACAAHVASYTATAVAALAAAHVALGLPLSLGRVAVGLSVSAVTHYLADRRTPLNRLAELTGNAGYTNGATVVRTPGAEPACTGPGTGLFELDQSLHYLFLFVAALLIAA